MLAKPGGIVFPRPDASGLPNIPRDVLEAFLALAIFVETIGKLCAACKQRSGSNPKY
jgi:hypothetical protein